MAASACNAFAMQPSLVFECNEDASVMGMSISVSEFGRDYSTHPGFRSQSTDGKYKVWTVPAGQSLRTFEWSCRIDGQDAWIKVWHQSTPKNDLIDKYGILHERCGVFRKVQVIYADKVVLKDIFMESDGCEELKFTLDTLYFAKMPPQSTGGVGGFWFSGSVLRGNRSDSVWGAIDSSLTTVAYARKQSKLPIIDKIFIDLFLNK